MSILTKADVSCDLEKRVVVLMMKVSVLLFPFTITFTICGKSFVTIKEKAVP